MYRYLTAVYTHTYTHARTCMQILGSGFAELGLQSWIKVPSDI